MKLLLFGGTAEGHRLAQALSEAGHDVTCCVATEYGRDVLEDAARLTVLTGRMDEAQMAHLMRQGFACVIDATHPYADKVSGNIRAAADAAHIAYERLIRPREQAENVIWAQSAQDAARKLEALSGTVLLTTGSKELAAFTAVENYRQRLFVRVLPSIESLSHALELGIPAAHIICMQGPFSREMNAATLRQIGASVLVTKDTGGAGGFLEKALAARDAGAKLLVIRRPTAEDGLTLSQMLEKYTGGRV